jgi:hypothetical protein
LEGAALPLTSWEFVGVEAIRHFGFTRSILNGKDESPNISSRVTFSRKNSDSVCACIERPHILLSI